MNMIINGTTMATEANTVNPFNSRYSELVYSIVSNPRKRIKAAIFYRNTKKVEICGMMMSGGVDDYIVCDHLPREGYNESRLDSDILKEGNFIPLNYLYLRYEDAVFLEDGKKVLLFDYESESARECIVEWKDYGYHSIYNIKFCDGTEVTKAAEEYERSYCFLNPEPVFMAS